MCWESGRTLVPLIEKSGGSRVCGEMSGVIGEILTKHLLSCWKKTSRPLERSLGDKFRIEGEPHMVDNNYCS